MAEAVGEEAVDPLLRDLGDLVREDRVAKHHAVLVVLVVSVVGGHPFEEPLGGRGCRRAQVVASEEDLELEDVGQLVGDELLELLVGQVHGQDHPVARGESEGADPLRDEVQQGVCLLEVRVRRVVDEVDRLGNLEIQLPGDVVVGALRVGRDLLERGALPLVEVDREVRRAVRLPAEDVVGDLVLLEVALVLGEGGGREEQEEGGENVPRRSAAGVRDASGGRDFQDGGCDLWRRLAWPLSHFCLVEKN